VGVGEKSQVAAVGLAIVSAVGWGAWGYFSNLASRHHSALSLWVTSVLIEGIIVAPFLIKARPSFSWAILGVAGFGVAGYAFFFWALKIGRSTAPLVAITALYPAVTLLLAVLFSHERFSARQYVGVGLAIVAVLLLSL
jgi:transporter family protein